MGENEDVLRVTLAALKPFAEAFERSGSDTLEMRAWVGSIHFEAAAIAAARAEAALATS